MDEKFDLSSTNCGCLSKNLADISRRMSLLRTTSRIFVKSGLRHRRGTAWPTSWRGRAAPAGPADRPAARADRTPCRVVD
jgi:hypothetical protein